MKKLICIFLCAAQIIAIIYFPAVSSSINSGVSAPAINKTFHLIQAQKLALANCFELQKTYNEILLKRMKLVESVNAIRASARNKQTLRWTPLITFKLPEKLNYPEEIELVMKPLTLTAEIHMLEHKMNDQRFIIIERVNVLFFSVYVLQEKVRFTEEILQSAQLELSRNRARLAAGTAQQSDIDTMQKNIEKLIGDLARYKRTFHNEKDELSELIELDITTGHSFAPPLQTAQISREHLDSIILHTLDRDHTFYQLKMDESLALINLNTTEELFRKQYGTKINVINPFIITARNGGRINNAAFRIQYDAMVKTFDAPWDGQIRILFIRFTREFMKGQISGTRYIDDEQYALFTACKEYTAARRDREKEERAIRRLVSNEFESLITAKNSAASMIRAVEDTQQQLDRVIGLNKIGKADYDEVKEKQEDYQAIQLDAIDALAAYNDLITNFDRLTCGAITKLLRGQELDTDSGAGGLSLPSEQVHYYIYSDVADVSFIFGLDVPDDFEPEITHFELWYEGVQIGARTAVDRRIKHLTLAVADNDIAQVRLFDGDDFIAQCNADITIARDILQIPKIEQPTEQTTEKTIGSYKIEVNLDGGVSVSTLTLDFNLTVGAGFYRIIYGENEVIDSQLIKADEGFRYLSLLLTALDDVTILIYDKDSQPLGEAWFNTSDLTIKQTITNE
jgi:hypothetical protein